MEIWGRDLSFMVWGMNSGTLKTILVYDVTLIVLATTEIPSCTPQISPISSTHLKYLCTERTKIPCSVDCTYRHIALSSCEKNIPLQLSARTTTLQATCRYFCLPIVTPIVKQLIISIQFFIAKELIKHAILKCI